MTGREKKCYFSHWFNPQMPAPSWGCGEIAEQGTPPRSPTSRPGAQILGPTPAALQYICRKLDQMRRSDSITSTQYGIQVPQEITLLCYNTHKQKQQHSTPNALPGTLANTGFFRLPLHLAHLAETQRMCDNQ